MRMSNAPSTKALTLDTRTRPAQTIRSPRYTIFNVGNLEYAEDIVTDTYNMKQKPRGARRSIKRSKVDVRHVLL